MRNFFSGFIICLLFMQHDPIFQIISLHLLQTYVYLKQRTTNLTIQKRLLQILSTAIGISVIEYILLKYMNIRFETIKRVGVMILGIATIIIQYKFELENLPVLIFYFIGHNLFLNTFISLIIFSYQMFNYNLENIVKQKNKKLSN